MQCSLLRSPLQKPQTGKFGLIVVECVKDLETNKGQKPTVLELLKMNRNFFPKVTVEKLTKEMNRLMHGGFLSVEHGSNRWSVNSKLYH